MNHHYETGGVPPLPPHLQDHQRKCIDCGHVFVGSYSQACPKCPAVKADAQDGQGKRGNNGSAMYKTIRTL